MTDKNEAARPNKYKRNTRDGEVAEYSFGLTAQEYAAIHLKVPDSGTKWLDEMIERSRRDEFAKRIMKTSYAQDEGYSEALIAHHTYVLSDAMLAASKGEK